MFYHFFIECVLIIIAPQDQNEFPNRIGFVIDLNLDPIQLYYKMVKGIESNHDDILMMMTEGIVIGSCFCSALMLLLFRPSHSFVG